MQFADYERACLYFKLTKLFVKQDIRKIVNQNYKRDPRRIDPDEMKYVDKDLIEPVKITDYPEIVLCTPPSNPQITVNTKPVEQIVKELAELILV